jgi:hypothetical protein
LDIEAATLGHSSMVDVQVLRAAQSLAADRPLKPGCDRFGVDLVPIDDGNVAHFWHGHSSWKAIEPGG